MQALYCGGCSFIHLNAKEKKKKIINLIKMTKAA